ncbi:hypothetical protein [Sandarakinorhabdus sp.]|uniref:hypothetical protein n=1 Tax=Sandarakinorhabdus sp. TaxID=1916663 RepID=UPI00286E41EC|nr:hypothetical protein [Sandarakinorhabdus sp.]
MSKPAPPVSKVAVSKVAALILLAFAGSPLASAERPPGYADLADLTLAAPVIVRGTIEKTSRLNAKAAPGLAAGKARLLVTARLEAALVAPGALPARLQWLWDAPLDARGKPPKVQKMTVLAWLNAPGADGATRLVSRLAQQPWDAGLESRVRAIAIEARSGKIPVVTSVSNGFRAEGTVPGESESQFFLTAKDGRPLTLVVENRPGEARRVIVSRAEIIDESAERVRPETLLWYRLACVLPAELPSTAGGDDPALAADWQAALLSLGPCGRTP